MEDKLIKTNTPAADLKKAVDAATAARAAFKESEDLPSDEKILAATAMMFYNDVDKNLHPIGFYEGMKAAYGSLNDEATFKAWARDVFAKTMLLDDAKWKAFTDAPTATALQEDPAFAYAAAFSKNYTSKYSTLFADFRNKNDELGRAYLKGIMEMNPAAVNKMYPDANFSMRVSYGNVKSYNPRDAVHYDYVCTGKGILEKYVPGDYEFDLPAKQVELFRKKDFGQYGVKGKQPVCFLGSNHTTGGNSGSPALDAYGNLVGLNFDRVWEGTMSDINYDPAICRNIMVDIRYVLFIVDKYAGAKNLISELTLVHPKKK